MKTCQPYRDQMLDALYGQLPPSDRAVFDDHRGSCPACAAEFLELSRVLNSLPRHPEPELPAEFWDGYWERLSRRMAAEAPSRPHGRLLPLRPWLRPALLAASALLLVGLGMFIGRRLPPPVTIVSSGRPQSPLTSTRPTLARDSRLEPLAEHLQRLEPLLIDWSQPAGGQTVAVNSADLDRLLLQNHLLKRLLARTGQKDKKKLLDELELIMLEMAAAERGHPPAAGTVSRLIDRYDVLFKVRIYSRPTKSI